MNQAVPLVDGNTQLQWPPLISATGHQEIVTLYGAYGNDERNPLTGPAWDHYQQGLTAAGQVQPLCTNGTVPNPTCQDGQSPAIVFLFIGFSNCTIEICGGSSDIWPGDGSLIGQPCSSDCPNPKKDNPPNWQPWNQAGDGITQRSFLYQVYPPQQQPLVGPHVYVFDGAKGHQTLDRWDPNGYYLDHDCGYPQAHTQDPECNFSRVIGALQANGLDPRQVQAVFIKMSTGGPQCDLSGFHCSSGVTEADAYTSERYLGNILRYLKHGFHQNPVRFPHLHQVFISSRTYGGYAHNPNHNACKLNPEPYAYEGGFGVQRLIVAQIKQAAGLSSSDQYAGLVDYGHAPWVDWGPYLWTNGDRPRQKDALVWCSLQQQGVCAGKNDVRFGDPLDQIDYWGDFIHPTYQGQEKVANQLVDFISDTYSGPRFVQPWIHQ